VECTYGWIWGGGGGWGRGLERRSRQVTSAGTIVVDSPLYTHCRLLLCVSVSAAELVGHCFQTDSTAELRSFSHIKYFILDGRPEAQYQAGHLPCAYALVR
jgi:hypothetical protein